MKIGPGLNQNWTRIGPGIGPELDQNWTRIGPELDNTKFLYQILIIST